MPVNVLRKRGARMSLQEALDRVEKLKRLSESSNPHEAAVAALRLKSFDVNAARAPRPPDQPTQDEDRLPDKPVLVLDEFPDTPYREIEQLEVRQDPQKKDVNWDELHFELMEKAKNIGADAILNFQLKGTTTQKSLCATALHFLNPKEISELQEATKLEDEEKAHVLAQKERRDEDTAPGYG